MSKIEHTTEYKQFLISAKQNIEYAEYLIVLSNSKLINDQQLLEKMNDELKQSLSELMLLDTQLKKLESQGEQIVPLEMQSQVAQAKNQFEHLENSFGRLMTQSKPVLEIDTVRWWEEVLVCRYIDAFEYYVSQVLLKVFISCPDLLKSSDSGMRGKSDNKVEVREVLEAGSIEEFIRRYADKKVTELGYSGLKKIIEYLNRKLGLEVDYTTQAFRVASEFAEVRNIIVHNAGRVSSLYLQHTGRTDLQEGDLYPLTQDSYTNKGTQAILEVAKEVDAQIAIKFKKYRNSSGQGCMKKL